MICKIWNNILKVFSQSENTQKKLADLEGLEILKNDKKIVLAAIRGSCIFLDYASENSGESSTKMTSEIGKNRRVSFQTGNTNEKAENSPWLEKLENDKKTVFAAVMQLCIFLDYPLENRGKSLKNKPLGNVGNMVPTKK